MRAREVEEKALKLTPPWEDLSLLLGAGGGEGFSVGTSKSAGISQATPKGELLPFLSCREGCATGCGDLPRQLPLGEDLALDPCSEGFIVLLLQEKRMAGEAEARDDEIQPCSSCSNYLCCQKNSRS